ncbi:MAG: hypothetical protein A2107_15905 [Verrucomicrobia bacterium GWF2_62_7]|nr:MAG: hypothetical protein A2107_15905 [Verrucomicrobia bacterium GWF2_62_7]
MSGKDLEVWTLQTVCDTGILLSVTTFVLHVGCGYFARTVRQLQAKMAEEMWWVTYLMALVVSLFVAVLLGFMMLNPDIMADIKIGLPFVPLATVLMTWAGLVKLTSRGGGDHAAQNWATMLLALAAVFNTIGFTLVMEAPGHEYAHFKTAFWQTMRSLRSNANPELAIWTVYICFAAMVALVIVFVLRVRRQRTVEESPLPYRRGTPPTER